MGKMKELLKIIGEERAADEISKMIVQKWNQKEFSQSYNFNINFKDKAVIKKDVPVIQMKKDAFGCAVTCFLLINKFFSFLY